MTILYENGCTVEGTKFSPGESYYSGVLAADLSHDCKLRFHQGVQLITRDDTFDAFYIRVKIECFLGYEAIKELLIILSLFLKKTKSDDENISYEVTGPLNF